MALPMKILIIYYASINGLLLLLMGYDKACAKKEKWRIPETSLFLVALLGGGIGGFLGMKIFHHKSKKIAFYLIFFLSILLHLSFIYLITTQFMTQ